MATTDTTKDQQLPSFDISWRYGQYRVSIPNFDGGEVVLKEHADARIKALEDKTQAALNLAIAYGWIDGALHKQWLIDQIVRVLSGDTYTEWVRTFNDGEDGPDTYEWDEGIAP